jgi:hypothetical protein
MKKILEIPKVLKLTKSRRIPKIKPKTSNQFPLDTAMKTSKPRKTKGIVVRLASRIKAIIKRKNAENFIDY